MMDINSRKTFGATYYTEISSLHTSDGLVTDNIEKAEALNAQFKSVFTVEPNDPPPDKGPSTYPIMPNIKHNCFWNCELTTKP